MARRRVHIGDGARGLGQARHELGIGKAGERRKHAGREKRERRRHPGLGRDGAHQHVDAGADDDADAVEEQQPKAERAAKRQRLVGRERGRARGHWKADQGNRRRGGGEKGRREKLFTTKTRRPRR
jgi:hypothetical protein